MREEHMFLVMRAETRRQGVIPCDLGLCASPQMTSNTSWVLMLGLQVHFATIKFINTECANNGLTVLSFSSVQSLSRVRLFVTP